MKCLIKKIGKLKRAIVGFYQDKKDKISKINENIEKIIIGKSFNNNDIECLKIGNGEKHILYTSGIHGNEVGTVKLAYNLINWFYENKDKLQDYSIFVIPCLNPDGYKLALKNPDYLNGGKTGRFNANNVDLNRNFKTNSFTKKSIRSFGKNYQDSIEVFCGEYGNSEPEIKSFTDFVKNNDIKIIFMFHNAGKDIMGNNTELAQKIAKIYSDKTGFKLINDEYWLNLKQTGTAKEWCDENGISYLEIEGTSRYGSDWSIQKEAIKETLFMI